MEITLLKLCALCLLAIWVIAIVRGIVALIARLRGSRPGIDWWTFVPLIAALALPASFAASFLIPRPGRPFYSAMPDVFGAPEDLIWTLFYTIQQTWFVWGIAISLLVAVPIFAAFRNRSFYWHLYLYGILGILAMPYGLLATELALEGGGRAGLFAATLENVPAEQFYNRYRLSRDVHGCTTALMQNAGLLMFDPKDYSPYKHVAEQIVQLWLDHTVAAATLEMSSAFGCHLTQIEHNPDDIPMSATVALYRAFVSLVVFGMILRPFVRYRTAHGAATGIAL
jgi:hypothetical protein